MQYRHIIAAAGKAAPSAVTLLLVAVIGYLFYVASTLWQDHKLRHADSLWEYQWGERGQTEPPLSGTWSPTDISDNSPGRDDRHYVWFRSRIPSTLTVDAHLLIPGAYQLMEVYFGQRKVLESPAIDQLRPETAAPSPVFLKILPEDYGTEAYIRVYSRLAKIGITGTPAFGKKSDLVEKIVKEDFARASVSFMVLFTSVILLLTLPKAPDRPMIALNSAYVALLAIHSFTRTRLAHLIVTNSELVGVVNLISLYAIPMMLGFYLTRLFRDRYTTAFRTISWLHSANFLGIVLLSLFSDMSLTDFHDYFGLIFIATVTIGGFILALRTRAYGTEGLLFLLTTPVIGIASVHDGLAVTGVIAWSEPLSIFGALPSILAMYFIGGKRWGSREREELPRVTTTEFGRHKFTGAFYGSFEARFRYFNFMETVNTLRASIHLTTVIALAMVWMMYDWGGGVVEHLGIIALLAGITVFINCTLLLVLKQKDGWKFTEPLLIGGHVVIHSSAIYIMMAQDPGLAKPLFGILMIIILGTYATGIGIRWHLTAATMSFLSVLWGLAIYSTGAHPTFTGEPRLLIFCLATVNMFGILTVWTREREARRRFVLTFTIEAEQQANEKLLTSILPDHVAIRLKSDNAIADFHAVTSVLFADLCGFTDFAAKHQPQNLVHMLDWLISEFDQEAARIGVEKIKIIGDCYMAVAGLTDSGNGQVDKAIRFGLAMNDILRQFNEKFATELMLRVGIHCGSLTAGVIGKSKFSYDVWGDAVNVAARMEQTCEPGYIQISQDAMNLASGDFSFVGPVEKDIKGKGKILTWSMPSVREEFPSRDAAQHLTNHRRLS